jgi:hypothetical protein
MIIVRVELWSARTGEITELARMMIDNVGVSDDMQYGDYRARSYRGKGSKGLDAAMKSDHVSRRGTVTRHPRLREHVWNLVTKALESMGYGRDIG